VANVLKLNVDDNVAVALCDLGADTVIELKGEDVGGLRTRQAIPFGHKVALADLPQGEMVLKYGASIGVASQPILKGEHVHIHNLKSVRGAAL
jgi:altronate dehydratase